MVEQQFTSVENFAADPTTGFYVGCDATWGRVAIRLIELSMGSLKDAGLAEYNLGV